MRRLSERVSAGLVLGALLVTMAPYGVTAASATTVSATTNNLDLSEPSPPSFSPNEDGVKDSVTITMYVKVRSRVVVRVTDWEPYFGSETVVRTQKLGWLDPGKHTWTWWGKTNAGHQITKEGKYRFRVASTSARGRDLDIKTVQLRNEVPGAVYTNRATVYPYATVRSDAIAIWWTPYDPQHGTGRLDSMSTTERVVIRDAAGRVVFDRRPDRRATLLQPTMLYWWARRDGRPLPAGDYQVTYTVTDAAGNTRSFVKTVTVSKQQLRRVTTVIRTGYADPSVYQPTPNISFDPNPPHGQDVVCPRAASPVFPEGGSRISMSCDEDATIGGPELSYVSKYPRSIGDRVMFEVYGGPAKRGDEAVFSSPASDNFSTPAAMGWVTPGWTALDLAADYYFYLPRRELAYGVRTNDRGDVYDVRDARISYQTFVPVD